ncbi:MULTISPECIES: hypothetical protein [Curtobacterium]|jgi:hypothetical protein|uniref:Uncharacterized protein n=1 Tax=Curtobacterium citri TaxID=3055139 RepID=A0ABT7TAS9_9MICO|nr:MULTISPECIES: hypothetical protein [Curtobacterium]MDM7886688.1 hypothetical protein [Curtobacterium citri]OEI68161.1 hypothetical protein Cus16_2257 [Curtobacterium sp. ER1/6]
MRDRHDLAALRQDPTEWHRRGMTAPAELDRMISERLGAQFSSTARSAFEPSYADFFTAA